MSSPRDEEMSRESNIIYWIVGSQSGEGGGVRGVGIEKSLFFVHVSESLTTASPGL